MVTLPIVWVPGHLCGAWLYAPQIEALGLTRPLVADVTRDDRIEAMAARLLADGPDRFVVAGLSMGGMVAMEAIAAAPGRIAGAVLMDTDPSAAREREVAYRAEQRAAASARGLEGAIRPFVERFFGHDPAAAARLLEPCLARMGRSDPAVYAAQADALDYRRDMLGRIAGFAGPVSVMVGAEDRICPARLHGPLAEALPEAELTVIPGAGHLATLEAPAAVMAALARLLDRVG